MQGVPAAQHPGAFAAASLLLLAAAVTSGVYQHPASGSCVLAVIAAYAFTDLYLNVLHAFLDREESLSHSLPQIRSLASMFQIHHGDTTYVYAENHMRDIDALISTVSLTFMCWLLLARALGAKLPRPLGLWTLAVNLLGMLAIFNHSMCHARNHGLRIPAWASALQDWRVLPSPQFHRAHHERFDVHFAFLTGVSPLFDAAYRRFPRFDVLHSVFFAIQPHVLISVLAAGALLRQKSSPKSS